MSESGSPVGAMVSTWTKATRVFWLLLKGGAYVFPSHMYECCVGGERDDLRVCAAVKGFVVRVATQEY